MGDERDIVRVVDRALAAYSRLDIVVACAATNPTVGPITAGQDGTTPVVFDKIMAVNVKGPWLLASEAYRKAFSGQKSGNFIAVGSIAGTIPLAGLGVYSISKAAVAHLVRVLAAEWGASGVRCNGVAPGLVKTKFAAALWDDAATRDAIMGRQVMPRAVEPEHVAGTVAFLASDASAGISGAMLPTDMGYGLGK